MKWRQYKSQYDRQIKSINITIFITTALFFEITINEILFQELDVLAEKKK